LLVFRGDIDQETAGNAASNQHDFQVALDQALKRQAAGITKADERMAALPQAAVPEQEQAIPNLRVVPAE
jgi:hypothetical protein